MMVIAVAMTACNKENTTQPEPASSLPLKAVTYIEENYPDAAIDCVIVLKNSAATYLTVLNTTEELAFNRSGDFLGDGRPFHGEKPDGDTIFGDTTCPGNGHHGGGHHGGGHHGGGHHVGIPIPLDSLPSPVMSYILDNYPGFSAMHAEADTLCPEGAVIEVMIRTTDSLPVKLIFDLGGSYLMKAGRIRYQEVPQAVKDYISANYTGWNNRMKAESLTLPDQSVQYLVYLARPGARKCVRIASDGILICER